LRYYSNMLEITVFTFARPNKNEIPNEVIPAPFFPYQVLSYFLLYSIFVAGGNACPLRSDKKKNQTELSLFLFYSTFEFEFEY
jgi:hypothetical protein